MLVAALAVMVGAAKAAAHPALATVVNVRLVSSDGGPLVEAVVTHDALAYALNDTSTRVTDPQMYALLDGPRGELAAALQDGRERFVAGFRILADGKALPLQLIESPTVDRIDDWLRMAPTKPLPCKMDFVVRATLPPGARSMRVRAPEVLDNVMLSVTLPGHEPAYLPLGPGEESPGFDVSRLGTQRPPETLGFWAVAWRYVSLGYRHIIPEGHDHELFILGLFLLNTRLRDVFWQTTAFTVAHTCTLTLATLGLVAAPPTIVEPVIAASIAFIAIENLLTRRVHPWRTAVAFVFGLVHGMGFAAGLREIGLPGSQLAAAIIAFNVGVEGGHLTILALAYATLGWWRNRPWFRPRIAMPLSVVIAAIALYWFVDRLA